MRACAFTTQEGGTAKTATTANLAAALRKKGKRVLVDDLCYLEDRTSREWGPHGHKTMENRGWPDATPVNSTRE